MASTTTSENTDRTQQAVERLRSNHDDTVEQFGHLGMLDAETLAAAARGKLDLNEIARVHLELTGVGKSGKWVGFDEAKRQMDELRTLEAFKKVKATPKFLSQDWGRPGLPVRITTVGFTKVFYLESDEGVIANSASRRHLVAWAKAKGFELAAERTNGA